MTYQVRTEVFEGPFDLLLHLISKRELDIYDVSLAAITEDYLGYLRQMTELDLEIATEFLVVAATLIEIKASRLLPGPPRDEDGPDVSDRDLLIARLLEYRAYKEAAGHLAGLFSDNAGYIARAAGPGEELAKLPPDLMARVSPQRFAEIAARALGPKPTIKVDVSHIAPIRVSVAEAIEQVRAMLRERRRTTFRQLTRGVGDRLSLIVRFLAVLELTKRGEADLSQAATFGEIDVEWLGDTGGPAPVDEYDGAWVDDPGRDAAGDEIRLDETVIDLTLTRNEDER